MILLLSSLSFLFIIFYVGMTIIISSLVTTYYKIKDIRDIICSDDNDLIIKKVLIIKIIKSLYSTLRDK